jgi:hypothetical protein
MATAFGGLNSLERADPLQGGVLGQLDFTGAGSMPMPEIGNPASFKIPPNVQNARDGIAASLIRQEDPNAYGADVNLRSISKVEGRPSRSPLASVAPMGEASPVVGGLPTTPNMESPVQRAIAKTRYEAGNIDGMNALYLQNLRNAFSAPDFRTEIAAGKTAMDEGRAAYLQNLKAMYSPERDSQLNWQALGKMGAGLMTGDWGAGQTAYQQARGQNQATLDAAGQRLAEGQYALGKEDYASAMAQQKLRQDTIDKAQENYVKFLKESTELKNATGQNMVVVESQTGAKYLVDKTNPAYKQLLLPSNGLTPQQGTELAGYRSDLEKKYSNPAVVNRLYAQRAAELRQANLKEIASRFPTEQIEVSDQPIETPQEMGGVQAPSGISGVFEPKYLQGLKPLSVEGQLPGDADITKETQQGMNKAALEELTSINAARSQAKLVYEAGREALAIDAKTGALQPMSNKLGAILKAVGADGTLTEEAIKGIGMDTISNQAVQALQNAAKGPQTEGDAQRFKESLINVKNPVEANKIILDYMAATAWKRDMEAMFYEEYATTNRQYRGAGNAYANWAKDVPLTRRLGDNLVTVKNFVDDVLQDNRDLVAAQGETYVTRLAVDAWRKLK